MIIKIGISGCYSIPDLSMPRFRRRSTTAAEWRDPTRGTKSNSTTPVDHPGNHNPVHKRAA